MPTHTLVRLEDESSATAKHLLRLIGESRSIDLEPSTKDFVPPAIPAQGLLDQLHALSSVLSSSEHTREAELLHDVYSLSRTSPDFGGLGFSDDKPLDTAQEAQVTFLVSAYMESLNSAERSRAPSKPLKHRPAGRRGMTLSEKIFAAHDVERRGEVKPGDLVRVDVDWILASELSWNGMERIYNELGKPGIFRNDRFWLAGDHVVDPRVMKAPQIQHLVHAAERARDNFQMTEYQGMNYTIMHTEFCRERAQPGMLIIGSDSHTCSAGSVGSLAIGLGVADVTLPLITGETWFRIPESINIRFINKPSPGTGGKDVILYILKELKRNTVASDRVVEYTGPGLKYLSCDARFAISNMTTEFGGVTGIFVPDEIVDDYINQRKNARYKRNAAFFRPDNNAQYALTYVIDLAKVDSFVARYPSPDDVVPVSEVEGKPLDGCFIGACTTTEEDLVLAALVLEQGLKRGMKPVKHGKRKVVPGSRPILDKMRKLGLTDIYEQAGFEVGIPGCSYCVGMSADKAAPGETWLSSQNRNFENRMGTGSFGNLASSTTVAASSFQMEITNPKNLLEAVDLDKLRKILDHHHTDHVSKAVPYVEPGQMLDDNDSDTSNGTLSPASSNTTTEPTHDTVPTSKNLNDTFIVGTDPLAEHPKLSSPPSFSSSSSSSSSIRHGKIARLGAFIDTDALAPAEALIKAKTAAEFGTYCLINTHPNFRAAVAAGQNIVVADEAFGCGSSRENAVTALQGAGVQCVIAKSFAFIYGRNQPNLGLLGITMTDARFFDAAQDGKGIRVDVENGVVEVEGTEEKFGFELSRMERQLNECGGLTEAFRKWGKGLWETLCAEKPGSKGRKKGGGKGVEVPVQEGKEDLQW